MTVSKAVFSAFLEANRSVFPYKDIRCTRTAYHPKWILFLSPCFTGSLNRPRNYFLLHVSCVSKSEVQQLIVSKAAYPLPSDYDEVIDVIDWWGRSLSGRWQQEVLTLVHRSLSTNKSMTRYCLMRESLELLLIALMDGYSVNNHEARASLLAAFQSCFQIMYEMTSGEYIFRELAVKTIHFFNTNITHHYNNSTEPATTLPTRVEVNEIPDDSVSSSSSIRY